MGVIRQAWVEKSSGGKKDVSTGAVSSGKENWKKRFVVVQDTPAPTLSWYKTDKVRRLTCHPKPKARVGMSANGTVQTLLRRRHLRRERRRRARSTLPVRRVSSYPRS